MIQENVAERESIETNIQGLVASCNLFLVSQHFPRLVTPDRFAIPMFP